LGDGRFIAAEEHVFWMGALFWFRHGQVFFTLADGAALVLQVAGCFFLGLIMEGTSSSEETSLSSELGAKNLPLTSKR
jgi:hypothetical protein